MSFLLDKDIQHKQDTAVYMRRNWSLVAQIKYKIIKEILRFIPPERKKNSESKACMHRTYKIYLIINNTFKDGKFYFIFVLKGGSYSAHGVMYTFWHEFIYVRMKN